jgi:hypothetical protein
MPHVDRLLTLAEMIGRVECAALHALYNEEYRFVSAQLIPHIDTVEAVLYERLEVLMGPRHTMAPMREEHETVRQLVAELGTYQVHEDHCTWNEMEGLSLRRALYRLHALLKVHLAEEEQYLAVLDRSLTAAEKDVLATHRGHGVAVLEHALELGVQGPLGGLHVRQQRAGQELACLGDVLERLLRLLGEERVRHLGDPIHALEQALVVLVGCLRQGRCGHGSTSFGWLS